MIKVHYHYKMMYMIKFLLILQIIINKHILQNKINKNLIYQKNQLYLYKKLRMMIYLWTKVLIILINKIMDLNNKF